MIDESNIPYFKAKRIKTRIWESFVKANGFIVVTMANYGKEVEYLSPSGNKFWVYLYGDVVLVTGRFPYDFYLKGNNWNDCTIGVNIEESLLKEGNNE